MRVFMTGATGFIGSYLVPELISAGHKIVGLTRSDSGAAALAQAGADSLRGDLKDLNRLREEAANADAVIHLAFNHDFTNLKQHSEDDRKVIETLGAAVRGTKRPLIVTSGTGLVIRSKSGDLARETDGHATSRDFPRAATEEAVDALKLEGVNVMVIRLPQVHDTRRQGRIAEHIKLAKQKGRVAYIGTGQTRLAASHVSDVVQVYRLALENGQPGAYYHAVAEEGVTMREIAEVLGAGLKMPVDSVTPEQAQEYFGWLTNLVTVDMAASSELTRRLLGWKPTGPSLVADLRNTDFGAV